MTIARIARDGVLLIVARGPAAELPLAVFTLGARPRAPTGDAALAAAADELRRAGAAWIVTGDTDTGRVTSLIERFVPASTAPARAVSSRPSRPASPADATGTRWTTPTSSVGADEALALAWFALAQRVGASAQVARGSGPPLLTMTLGAASSREADARLARARARLLRDGVSADEVDGFRRSREAAALSRTPEEWATRLALQELHDGDARRAGRELALVWEAGAAGVRRALLGPLAPARLQEQHPR
ncbi:MAG: hypothetical protein IT374_09365 [Polyangiaceae bacterium]|nr:hypothetical protein [Polyangiaceae bacterium]